ncbi:DEAD/DEAH box helicase family protein [bacterium]|nr:DEAD/DEAH box helicase family protein [bacterium]
MTALSSQPLSGDTARGDSLRAWQREALAQYLEHLGNGRRQLLWEATPGAGKTTAALRLCRHQLRHTSTKKIIIVVPTAHLKLQWAQSAKKLGLELDSAFRSNRKRLSSDYHGIVVTFQQVAQEPTRFRRFAEEAVVVLDEVHHAGDGLSWGDGLIAAFSEAQFVLALSGTPFRSDSNAIPFISYSAEGFSEPDYLYSHSQAVRDGVCRPVVFLTYGGSVSWSNGAGTLSADFSDPLDREGAGNRLRAALDPESGWIDRMLEDANSMLQETRKKQPDAGGLLVCRDRAHARQLAKRLAKISHSDPVVVLSDDRQASKKITLFSESNRPWIIACNMVSEGVDIPRLRVGVFSTVIQTRMYFRQFLGRIVRRQKEISEEQVAYCYLPADPVLSLHAEEIDKEQKHSLEERTDEEERREQERSEPKESHFEAMNGVNTGIDRMILDGNQLAFWEGGTPTESTQHSPPQEERTRSYAQLTKSERKALLSKKIQRLVSQYRHKTGSGHAQIHSHLNRKQSVKCQQECTEKQLLQRIEFLHSKVRAN